MDSTSSKLPNYLKEDVHRLEFIDIAKGIGIFLVISSHVYGYFMSWALPFYIPLFFVTSGYCTIRPIKLRTKFKKLIIPYFFFSFLILSIKHSFYIIDLIGVIYSRWCVYTLNSDNNIFLLRSGNGPLWFLTSMYVSCLLLYVFQKHSKPILLIILYFSTAILLSFLPILLPWSIDTAFLMVIFICFGIYLREKELLNKLNIIWLCCMITLYIILCFFCGNINLSVRIYGHSILLLLPTALLGSTLLLKISIFLERTLIGHLFSMVGHHSLSIFCLQIPFIELWEQISKIIQIKLPAVTYEFLCIIFVLSITYPISILLDKYVLRVITNYKV